MRPTELVVFSGGLDSTVCLALAARGRRRSAGAGPHLEGVLAVSFDYGQRQIIELERARTIAAYLGVEHLVVALDRSAFAGSALTDPAVAIPLAPATEEPLDPDHIPATYVPGRNLIFLSLAAGIAEVRGCDRVTIGVNAVDYSGYPDCRPAFIEAFSAVANLALKRAVNGNPIEIHAPLLEMSKSAIVKLGIEYGAPLQWSWSCYAGGEQPCDACDSCALRARGFAEAGIDDPARRIADL